MTTKISELKFLILLVSLLIVVGGSLLVVAYRADHDSMSHHLSRDIGLAFLISALVTIAYETYARSRFDLAKIESLLETVYGSGVPAGIWQSIKENLLKRKVIRLNPMLHVSVSRDPSIGEDGVLMDLDLTYDLVNLLKRENRYTVVHGLDEHIAAAQLPRFIEASIADHSESIDGQDPWVSSNGDMTVESGRLALTVNLGSAGEDGIVRVRVRRQEYRVCPGSYYLIMSDITQGMTVFLRECAPDVDVTVFVYPTAREINLTTNHIAMINEPLLPGHCLEFKLRHQPQQGS
jgi:hypothetical protein